MSEKKDFQYQTQYGVQGSQQPPPQTVIIQQPSTFEQNAFFWSPPNTGWMPKTNAPVTGCPPGMENIASLSHVYVKQYVELLEALTGIHFRNRYSVQNENGEVVLIVSEETELGQLLCCGPYRGFKMHVMDQYGMDVMLINRQFKCCTGCCWCASPGNNCSIDISVECPPGNVVGYVKQERYCCSPYLGIYDGSDNFISAIRGPCCPCICPCFTLDYNVSRDRSGNQLTGAIQHIWGGCLHDYCTNADDFKLTFPPDADISMKALMIGASIILDFMFFENKKNNNNN